VNGVELTTAGTFTGGPIGAESKRRAWHTSFLSITLFLGILGIVQILFIHSHVFRELFYLAYFVPIAIAAMHLSWRSAVEASTLAAVVYLLASTPVMVLSSTTAPDLIAESAGHVLLFLVAGMGLSTYRFRVGQEKDKAIRAERERSEKLELMLDVSTTVSSSLKLEQVLQVLAVRIAEATEATFCRISLLDDDGKNLRVVAVYPVRNLDWEPSIGRTLPLDELPDHKKAMKTREAVLVGGKSRATEERLGGPHEQSGSSVASLVLYPLVVGSKAVGIVGIGERRNWDRSPLTHDKTAICQTIVNQGAKAVAHAMTHQDLEEAFLGTIRSLAEAIDAKDPSTHGHSEWVSRYAVMIGGQLRLGDGELNELRYAGYLHDVGKIGISDGILGKPSHLTADQWKMMKKHPVMGDRILKPVKISPMVKAAIRHHHERFDAYEAMTADRPYRKALSDQQAVNELKRCSGTQFDPQIVEAFLAVMGRPSARAMETGEEAAAS
jgi:HD-GYP domain-containing protein (c-di-GMP phosphodiesterase class II)